MCCHHHDGCLTCRGKNVALDIATGLFYLHSRAICHLDIKSPNILLTKDYTAKIADVGIARILMVNKTRLTSAPFG